MSGILLVHGAWHGPWCWDAFERLTGTATLRRRLALDPFVHMDQMGEVDYAPGEPKGTPWHPHRGFETVTYMIDGIFRHQDSNGGRRADHRRRHPVDDRRSRLANVAA